VTLIDRKGFYLTVEGVIASEKGRFVVSNRLLGCTLLTVCAFGQTSAYGQRIQEVQSEKRAPLKTNPQLAEAAQAFAEYLAHTDNFSHTADGKEPWDRTTKAGYQHCIILENIASEYNSDGFTAEALAGDCVGGWENSPGHRKNMLDKDVQDIGFGLARSSRTGRYYAVQDFGRPKSAMITFKVANRTDTSVTYTIDGQTCTASPGYTITYERSRPPELRFPWSDKVNVTQAARKVFRPASGASYTIRTTGGDAVTVDSQ